MRWFCSKRLVFLLLLLMPTFLQAQDVYEKRVKRYVSTWDNLIPRYTKLQFAGSIGVVSFGGGWNYGKNRWETDLLLGIVPKTDYQSAMPTLTLKQNYLPWKIALNERFMFEPLNTGIFFNTLIDRDFWTTNPDKYPDGYYTFSTRIRIHAFLGQRITINLDRRKAPNRSITLFYELSSCDLYVINAVKNSYLKPTDYLSLAFGVKIQIL